MAAVVKPDIFLEQRLSDWQLDEGFQRRQAVREEAEWAAVLEAAGSPGQPSAGQETPPAPKPSAIVEGAKAGAMSFIDAGKQIADGLMELAFGTIEGGPARVMPMIRKVLIDGVLAMPMAPFVALGTGAGQALENENPGLAASELLPRSSAYFLRRALSLKAESAVTPEEREAWATPMSVREGLETAMQLGVPLLAGPAVKGGKKAAGAAKEINARLGERGSVGPAPPGGEPRRPPPVESVRGVPPPVTNFETAQGSTYTVDAGGRTQRTKSKHAGHDPKDVGLKTPSDRTVYVSPEQAAEIGSHLALNKEAKPTVRLEGDKIVLESRYGKGPTGELYANVRRQEIVFSEQPEVGKAPVEFWDSGSVHPGNAITNVGGAAQQAKKGVESMKAAPERGSVGPEPALPGEPLQPRANMARVGAEPEVKALIAEMDLAAQEAGLIRKEVISRMQTAKAAEAKGLTIERALKLDYEDLHANATGLRDLRDHAFRQLRELEIASDGSPAAEAKLMNAAVLAAMLEAKAVAVGTDVGRALGSFNIISDAGRAYAAADIAKLAKQIKAGMLPGDTLTARLRALATKEQRRVFLRQLVSGTVRGTNVFYEAWINGLLSNPVSHAANVASNAIVGAWGIVERQQAGLFNVLMTRDPEGVRMGEAAVMLRASVRASGQSFIVAGKTLREGKSPFGGEKMEVAPALTAERMGLNPENPLSGAVDFTGSGIRLPGRLMMTEDAYFKWWNYTIDMEARAYREGRIAGLRGDDLAAFTREFLRDPPAERRAPSEAYAEMQTFTRAFTEPALTDRIGQIGQLAQRLPMARLILPFMVTPVQAGGYAWRRMPVLNVLSESFYRDVAAGGAKRDLALARWGTAAMLAAAYMELAGAGLVTGAGVERGDAKDALKQLGRQDYAARVGDDLYRIQRLAPPGMMIGALASYAEIAGQLPEQARIELGVALAMAMAEGIKDQPFFTGVSNVFQAVQSPGSASKNFLDSMARTMIPYSGLVHQVKKTGIPGVLEGDPHRRVTVALTEWERLLNVYKADLPGYSRALPSMRNQLTGHPIVLPPGWGPDLVSPIAVTHLVGDPVFEAIARNRPSLREVPKAIAGKVPPALQMRADQQTDLGIPLTAWEQDEIITILTSEVKDAEGLTLHRSLTKLVQSEAFQALEPGRGGGQKHELEKRHSRFLDQALVRFRERHDDIDRDVKTIVEQRLLRRRGQGAGRAPALQIAPGMTLPGAR